MVLKARNFEVWKCPLSEENEATNVPKNATKTGENNRIAKAKATRTPRKRTKEAGAE